MFLSTNHSIIRNHSVFMRAKQQEEAYTKTCIRNCNDQTRANPTVHTTFDSRISLLLTHSFIHSLTFSTVEIFVSLDDITSLVPLDKNERFFFFFDSQINTSYSGVNLSDRFNISVEPLLPVLFFCCCLSNSFVWFGC